MGVYRVVEGGYVAGEFRFLEGDLAAGEFRTEEGDLAAGELCAVKIATVERGVREVEVTITPGGRIGGVLEMIANDANNGVSDFSLTFTVFLAGRVGFVRHAQVGAQDVDANLALLAPVVGESGHRVDTREAHSGFLVPKLFSGCGVSLGELLGVGSMCVSLDESLLAVAVDADEDGAKEPGDGNRGLDDVERIDSGWPAVGHGMRHSDRL